MAKKIPKFKTKYVGVRYIIGRQVGDKKKDEKIFYVTWTENGRVREQKAGRQYADKMTAAKAARIRADIIQGKRLTNVEIRKLKAEKKWVISELWKEYLKGKELKGLKTDSNRFEKHIEPVFGNKRPEEIDPLSVERFRRNLSKKRATQTVNNILELLRRIVNFGTEQRLTPGLDFKIKLKKANNETTEDLNPAQFNQLLNVLETHKDRFAANFMLLALYTGMRRGELFKLKWKDINSHTGFIHIVDPKGGPDQRIPLNKAARRVLESHSRSKSPYVFPGRNGRQRTDIKRRIAPIRKAAKLPAGFRPLHGLRHVYASMLASSGKVDMYILQKLLTHKDPQMTQRYAHLRDAALKGAADVADDIFSDASGAAK
jgi:integrase